jgi:hypothetical protein
MASGMACAPKPSSSPARIRRNSSALNWNSKLNSNLFLAGWRLQRAGIYDAAISARLFRSASRNRARRGAEPDDMKAIAAMLHEDAEGKKVLDYVSRIEGRHRRTYQKAIQDLGRLQAARRAQVAAAAEPPPVQPSAPEPPPPEAPPPELALVAHVATSQVEATPSPNTPKLASLVTSINRRWRALHTAVSGHIAGIGASECAPLNA